MKKITALFLLFFGAFFLVPSVFATDCTNLEYIILKNGQHLIGEPQGKFVDNPDGWLVHNIGEFAEEVADPFFGSYLEADSNDIDQRSVSHGFYGINIATDGLNKTITLDTSDDFFNYEDQSVASLPFEVRLSGGSCPTELKNYPYPLIVNNENMQFSTTIQFKEIPAGISCDINLYYKNENLCDFNWKGNEGKLTTDGDRNEDEEKNLLQSINGVAVAGTDNSIPQDLCKNLGAQSSACYGCINQGGAYTAIGCIPIDNMTEFIKVFLRFAVGIGGGIAFLMIIAGGFVILTSSGNPEKLQMGREIITNAIAGLLLIIFSAVILRIVGVDILQIPGFGTKL